VFATRDSCLTNRRTQKWEGSLPLIIFAIYDVWLYPICECSFQICFYLTSAILLETYWLEGDVYKIISVFKQLLFRSCKSCHRLTYARVHWRTCTTHGFNIYRLWMTLFIKNAKVKIWQNILFTSYGSVTMSAICRG